MDPTHKDTTGAGGETGLHICPECSSKLVQPVRWEQTTKLGYWRLWRRCPNCNWRCESVHGEAEVDAYDETLEAGSEAVRKELKVHQLEVIADIVDPFAKALAADLITADDFS